MEYVSTIADQELAEKLIDSSIDRLMAVDLNWKIIAWNKTSEALSGFPRKEVLGKHLFEIFPDIRKDEEMIAAISQAFRGWKTFLSSNTAYLLRVHVEHHFIPLTNDEGGVIGVMGIMHDVSHRIKAEKELKRLNSALQKKYVQLEKANNDLATFTYIASREIQAPIKNVYTSIEFIARKEGNLLSNLSRGSLRKMQASLSRMNLLLDDLLAISRIHNDPDEFTPVDLNSVLENVKIKMAQKLSVKGATLNVGHLPLVRGSADMLGYLFQHLIDNSLKFQPENQIPIINVYCEQLENEDISAENDNYYSIVVRDNGIGFEQNDAETIFDMFSTLQRQSFRGSGIGLALCKRIMDSHEGTITAESSPGEGAAFKCIFPTDL